MHPRGRIDSMAGRWRTDARDALALETVDTILAELPEEVRAHVQSHTPTRARVIARSDYISHLAVAQGQLAVALNAEVKIGETLGMFRDTSAADTINAVSALMREMKSALAGAREGNSGETARIVQARAISSVNSTATPPPPA